MSEARQLSETEREIIEKMLGQEFPGSKQLKQQLANCMARETGDTDNYGNIYLETSSKEKADVLDRVPVEAVVIDDDGVPMNILLHVVDGCLNELEIFKADGSPIHIRPSAENISVTINDHKP